MLTDTSDELALHEICERWARELPSWEARELERNFYLNVLRERVAWTDEEALLFYHGRVFVPGRSASEPRKKAWSPVMLAGELFPNHLGRIHDAWRSGPAAMDDLLRELTGGAFNPPGATEKLARRVCVERGDFRVICRALGWGLPQFWFGDEAGTSVPASREALPNTWRRDSEDSWFVCFQGRSEQIRSKMIGFAYLATLLREPRREFDPLELQGTLRPVATDRGRRQDRGQMTELYAAGDDEPVAVATLGSAGETMDARTPREIERRLEDLVRDRQASSDPEARLAAQREIDQLRAYLDQNRDHRGKPRRMGDPRRSAQNAVRRAILRAVRVIEERLPDLGKHLNKSLDYARCTYAPETSTEWTVP